jgi:tRNA(Ile)-lysidine synthetase-like protein
MSSVRGSLVRPLLPFRRAAVRGYVAERGLPHWNDPANTDPAHLRSWIRTELLPLLGRRESGPEQRILRLARQASVEREAWDLALDRLAGLAPRGEADGASADAGTLYRMPAPLRSTVLQALARRAGLVLGPQRAGRALRALDRSGSGSAADLGGGWRLERAFGRLRIVAPSPVPSDGAPLPSVSLEGETGAARWGEWRLSWSNEPAPPTRSQSRDGLTAWFIPDRLRVRGWQAGDRLFPLHGRGRRLAVRCFQEKRVPRSERAGWPLLEGAGGLLWIPGVCRSGAQVPEAGDPAMRIDVVRS